MSPSLKTTLLVIGVSLLTATLALMMSRGFPTEEEDLTKVATKLRATDRSLHDNAEEHQRQIAFLRDRMDQQLLSLSGRVENLEDRILAWETAQQEGTNPETGDGITQPWTQDELWRRLAAFKGWPGGMPAEWREERIQTYEMLLDKHPNHFKTWVALKGLCWEHYASENPHLVLSALDQYGHRIKIQGWNLQHLYAGAYSNLGDEARARLAYEEAMSFEDVPDHIVASSLFLIAFSYQSEVRTQEALSGYRALMDRFGSSTNPMVEGSIKAARQRIGHLEEAR